jgi:predicted transcriptional regulator of viral defense system
MGTSTRNQRKAVETFRHAGGVLRTSQALEAGIHPRDLYALRDTGILTGVSRGVYRLTDLPPLREPDLVTVAARVPKAVICLISALHFHGLTPEIPHVVSIALLRGTATPKLAWPPVTVYRLSRPMFEAGIEFHERDGVRLRVYSPAKTIADCFKFRNRLGIDVALDALRSGLSERKVKPAEVMHFARICRVDKVMRPFLEALV